MRTVPDFLISDVSGRSLNCDGKYFGLIYKLFIKVEIYVSFK